MSHLSIALLSSSKLPTLGAFILHAGSELSVYSDLDELLVEAVSKDFHILFCEQKLLLDENTEDRLLRFLQRKKDLKIFILNEDLKYYRLDSSGAFNPDDLSSIKKILNSELALRKFNLIENDSNEIIIEVDEESEDSLKETAFVLEAEKIKKCQNIDDLGKALLKAISILVPEKSALLLKYLPNYCSLVVLGGVGFSEASKYSGMGLNFSSSKDFSPKLHLSRIADIPAFKKIAKSVFKGSAFEILPILVEEVPRLLIAVEGRQADLTYQKIKMLTFLAEEKAEAIVAKTKYHKVKIYDELSGLLLREAFFDRMQDEYTRAKRIFLPVTIVVFEIDNFLKLKDFYNKQRIETLLKMMAKILKENVRHNDYIGQLSENRFALLLPHMTFTDAKNKVKKLRNVISQTKFFSDMSNKLSITVSSSVVTYPRFSHTADEGLIALENSLDQNTFTDAVIELNPREGFRPDFKEIKLPSTQSEVLTSEARK